MPPPKESRYRLLVEGTDDKFSVINLMNRHGFDWDDQSVVRPYVHPTEGWTNLLGALPAAVKTFERLGIVIDADLSPVDRWDQVRGRMAALGHELPDAPAPEGTVLRPAWCAENDAV